MALLKYDHRRERLFPWKLRCLSWKTQFELEKKYCWQHKWERLRKSVKIGKDFVCWLLLKIFFIHFEETKVWDYRWNFEGMVFASKVRHIWGQSTSSQRKVKVKSLSCVRLFATPWIVAHQAPLSVGFSRQEYWSGLPFPSPGDLPDQGIEPRSPVLQADALTSEPPGKPPK